MSSARSEHELALAGGAFIPLIVQRHGRARRMKLRFDGLGDRALLTIPPRASLRSALDWARQHAGWVESQRARAGSRVTLGDGALIPVEGEPLRIIATGAPTRAIRQEGETLLVGGPPELAGARLLRWLKAHAKAVLAAESEALAARHGLPLGRVSIGDPRGRWGSCSARGDIRYSWRLILAPPHVRLAIVAHEVAHLKHMHHGPDFHAFVAEIAPVSPAAASAWLKRHGRDLHRYDA